MTADSHPLPAKTLRADARRNRQRVLEAAESAFAGEGIAVPIDEIARRAGVGAGTVYRHFPTKDALFEAIMTSRLERMTAQARCLTKADDAGAAFFGFLTYVVEEGIAKRDLVDALAAGGFDVSRTIAAVGHEFQDAVVTLMVRAQRAKAVRDDVGAADLMALMRGVSLAVRDSGGADVARRLVGILSDGLKPQH